MEQNKIHEMFHIELDDNESHKLQIASRQREAHAAADAMSSATVQEEAGRSGLTSDLMNLTKKGGP